MKLGKPMSCVIEHCHPLFSVQPLLPSLASTPRPDTTFQNHGSLLSTLQAPNTWFLYPITLNKREYCLAIKQRIPRHSLGKCIGTISGKEPSPSKDFVCWFSQAHYLPENFAPSYIMLWLEQSHFSLALCQNIQEIKPTSIPCLQKRGYVWIHTISWAHNHIIKVIVNLSAFYQTMNHFYTDPPQDSYTLAREHFKCVAIKCHE